MEEGEYQKDEEKEKKGQRKTEEKKPGKPGEKKRKRRKRTTERETDSPFRLRSAFCPQLGYAVFYYIISKALLS